MMMTISLLLSACAQPSYYAPKVYKDEAAAERSEQLALSKQVDSKALQKELTRPLTEKERLDMDYTIKLVGGRIQAAGKAICQQITSTRNPCSYRFELDKENPGPNAYADGERIVVSPAMMRFTQNENELAVVLAHEYAHNAVGHPAKTQQNATLGTLVGLAIDSVANSQGVGTGGAFTQLGGQVGVLRYSQAFEKEADYIGLYIVDAAGFDAARAADFWRRMAQQSPESIRFASTHPTTPERYLLLTKTYREIESKRQIGMPLLPEKLPPG